MTEKKEKLKALTKDLNKAKQIQDDLLCFGINCEPLNDAQRKLLKEIKEVEELN